MIFRNGGAVFLKFLLVFFAFKCVYNTPCNFINSTECIVSLKDFNVSRTTVKNYFCTAYFRSPVNEPMKAIVHSFSKKFDTLIHAGPYSLSFNEDCENCSLNATNEAALTDCTPCASIQESPEYEIHFRVDRPLVSDSDLNEKPCDLGDFFNITIETKNRIVKEDAPQGCKDGYLVTIPKGDACDIVSLEGSEEKCINTTCSRDVIIKNSTDHDFFLSTSPGICIWKLNTNGKKYLEFRFSPEIKNKLIIFEETLLTPKWYLGKCSSISDTLKLKTSLSSFYIMYKSDEKLENKPMISIKFKKDFCPLPPIIDNAKEEFFRNDNGTISLYTCNEGYKLEGPKEIACINDIWGTPPMCLLNKTMMTFTDYEDDGSGNMNLEAYSDVDAEVNSSLENEEIRQGFDDESFNISISSNETYPWSVFPSSNDNLFISFPNLEDNLILFILVGIGISLIVIITILSVILCRNRRSNMNRTFDTFQNPIYEKPVVRVPIVPSNSEPAQEKLDLGDLSDSTVLDM